MTELEIDRALALAIGWERQHLMPNTDAIFVLQYGMWHFFSHKDWNVISPIAARYNAFPVLFDFDGNPKWYSNTWTGTRLHEEFADTPQRAIALAVIGALK